MAIKGNVKTFGSEDLVHFTIGVGEDVKGARDLAGMEKAGWPMDDGIRSSYKVFLSLKRQGDVDAKAVFSDWVETVEAIDYQPSAEQIEDSFMNGNLTREQADYLKEKAEAAEGEATPPPY